jgi:uncharacterized RDD family membrane protein YckC
MEKHPEPQLGTNGEVIAHRILAFFIDGILVAAITSVLFGVGGPREAALLLFGLFGLVGLAFSLVYFFLLEGLYGYTPGKYVLGLVVKSDGSDCTITASILRNLLWLVDSLPVANLIAIVLILLTEDNQRVGDLVADTVVVRQRYSRRRRRQRPPLGRFGLFFVFVLQDFVQIDVRFLQDLSWSVLCDRVDRLFVVAPLEVAVFLRKLRTRLEGFRDEQMNGLVDRFPVRLEDVVVVLAKAVE